ncbi:MAG: hypothetical protein QOD99_2884 [Chthoniobacter sp.]|nr:hypothetical protein [Chthoniobacter sp.]
MWVFDEETLGFLAVNDAAVRHYGYSREEFLGMSAKEIRPTAELPGWLEYRSQLTLAFMEFGAPTQWTHRRKDGSNIEVECKGATIRFNGRSARLIIIEDITERKKNAERMREAAENFHLLFVSAGEGIIIHEQGKILAANPALLTMLGHEGESLIGRNLLDLVAPESHTHVLAKFQTASGEPLEFSLFRADGTRVRTIGGGRSMRFHGRSACLLWLRDISERVFADFTGWMREPVELLKP